MTLMNAGIGGTARSKNDIHGARICRRSLRERAIPSQVRAIQRITIRTDAAMTARQAT